MLLENIAKKVKVYLSFGHKAVISSVWFAIWEWVIKSLAAINSTVTFNICYKMAAIHNLQS